MKDKSFLGPYSALDLSEPLAVSRAPMYRLSALSRHLGGAGKHRLPLPAAAATARLHSTSTSSENGMESGVVSVEWLAAELASAPSDLRVVDASWFLGGKDFTGAERDAQAEFASSRIPGAAFFDVDAVATTAGTELPHMMPDAETFAKAMKALGVDKGTRVVAYDALGMFSAPRCWFTLRTFGHPCVAVLDGGFHKWKESGAPMETGAPASPAPGADEAWTKDDASVWDLSAVVANAAAGPTTPVQLVDARPAPRFEGTAPEPREGMRGGHVPNSFNVPFGALVDDFPGAISLTFSHCRPTSRSFNRPAFSNAFGLIFRWEIGAESDFALKMMDCALKMMDFAFKMLHFVFKMDQPAQSLSKVTRSSLPCSVRRFFSRFRKSKTQTKQNTHKTNALCLNPGLLRSFC